MTPVRHSNVMPKYNIDLVLALGFRAPVSRTIRSEDT